MVLYTMSPYVSVSLLMQLAHGQQLFTLWHMATLNPNKLHRTFPKQSIFSLMVPELSVCLVS